MSEGCTSNGTADGGGQNRPAEDVLEEDVREEDVAHLREHVEQLEADMSLMARELRETRDELERSEGQLEASRRELTDVQLKLDSVRGSISFEVGQIIGRGVKRPSVDTLMILPRIARRLMGKPKKASADSAVVAAAQSTQDRMLAPAPVPRRPGKPLVGAIMDTFTKSCLGADCDLLAPRPDNWRAAFESQRPDVMFVESAWHGNDDAWQYRVASYASPPDRLSLPELLKWCRKEGVPTIFWNKEDPVHFLRFVDSARRCDAVLTTDADCVPRYHRSAGHEQVFAMPFAAQPHLHHPTRDEERLDRACFAGSYYADRHDARRVDMEAILEPALDFPFDIFDRNFGAVGKAAEKTAFPERFRGAIRGRLEYDEMVRAYKRYRVFLNVNSVKDSPTMFSRRVFELLACGTPVVSSYSKGIVELLGEDAVMIAETAAETRAHLERLLGDDDAWARLSALGLCRVHAEHTYLDRLADAWQALDLPLPKAWRMARDPALTAVAEVPDAAAIQALAAALAAQHRKPSRVVLIADAKPDAAALEVVGQSVSGAAVDVVAPDGLASSLAAGSGDIWAAFDPGAHYGAAYLDDAVAALRYARAPVLGRAAHFAVGGDGGAALQRPADEHRLVAEVPAASVVARAGAISADDLLAALRDGTYRASGPAVQALHRFNFATARPRDASSVDLEWRRP
jgi:spore maturation protein CgeB